jgi:PAS domain S-box-containing protein
MPRLGTPEPSGPGRPGAISPQSDELALARLAAIVEWSDDAIVSKDLNGTIRTWNRAAERMFGYSATEAVGRSILTIVPPDRHVEEHDVLSRIRAGESVDHFETVRMRKDGTLLEVSITVSPIRNAEGAIVGASKISRDISERRRQERLQRELLDRERISSAEATAARDRVGFLSEISAVLGSSLDFQETVDNAVRLALPTLGDYCTVLVQDENGALSLVACAHVVREQEAIVRAAARLLAEPTSDIPSFSAQILRTGVSRIVPRIVESPEFRQVQRTNPGLIPDHAGFSPCSYLGVPLMVRGRPVGVISFGTTTDLSNREYTAADLPLVEEFARRVALSIENARLYRQADELNRLKDEFLATLSHELRTPLNAILGWARLAADGRLKDDALRRAVIAIERNASAQSKIVDDILDVARGVAGNLQLDVAPLDLADVAQRGVDAIVPAAAAKHIDLELAAPAHPVPVSGDPSRMGQVIGNLLSNAVKFTPDGGRVVVEVSEAGGYALLSVADTGIGIPATFLPHIFDKFRQADGSHTRRYGGLGLGLAISRHLIELHGGTIEARSEGKNKGTTIVVRLPIARRSGPDA